MVHRTGDNSITSDVAVECARSQSPGSWRWRSLRRRAWGAHVVGAIHGCWGWMWRSWRPTLPQRKRPDVRRRVADDITAQPDYDSAARVLFQRLIPNPQRGFAAIIESPPVDDQPIRSRGLCQESRRKLTIGDDLLDALREQPWVTLAERDLRRHEMFQNLAVRDRRKADELYLFRWGDPQGDFDVLVTTDLIPDDPTAPERESFLADLVESLRHLRQKNRRHRAQQIEAETDDLLAALDPPRPVDGENPLERIGELLDRLRGLSGVDRTSLFMRHGGDTPLRFVVSGTAAPPRIDEMWQQHERALAAICFQERRSRGFNTGELKRVGIETLVSGAMVAPVRMGQRVVGAVCLTSRGRWPQTVSMQALVDACVGLIEETWSTSCGVEQMVAEDNAQRVRRTAPAAESDTSGAPLPLPRHHGDHVPSYGEVPAVIHYEMVLDRAEGDERLVRDILESFLTDSRDSVAEIQVALSSCDLAAARRCSRDLHDSAADFGATALALVAGRIAADDESEVDALLSRCDMLEETLEQIRIYAGLLD